MNPGEEQSLGIDYLVKLSIHPTILNGKISLVMPRLIHMQEIVLKLQLKMRNISSV